MRVDMMLMLFWGAMMRRELVMLFGVAASMRPLAVRSVTPVVKPCGWTSFCTATIVFASSP
jgi:hypothetical protein